MQVYEQKVNKSIRKMSSKATFGYTVCTVFVTA